MSIFYKEDSLSSSISIIFLKYNVSFLYLLYGTIPVCCFLYYKKFSFLKYSRQNFSDGSLLGNTEPVTQTYTLALFSRGHNESVS